MKRIIIYLCSVLVLSYGTSCKKNDPITDLGTTNGEFAAQLRVSFNNTRPVIGDTLIVTASTWQRDDRFEKIRFNETVFETFGIELQLEKGSSVITKTETFSTLLLTDTIKNKSTWKEVMHTELDDYWVTSGNNYVIRGNYMVKKMDGMYPNDNTLVGFMPDNEFAILKSLLAYAINRDDYLSLFPTAPATHFSGGTYVLTPLGMSNLKDNLTKTQLQSIIKSTKKIGSYGIIIDVDAITPTGATTNLTRTFDINL